MNEPVTTVIWVLINAVAVRSFLDYFVWVTSTSSVSVSHLEANTVHGNWVCLYYVVKTYVAIHEASLGQTDPVEIQRGKTACMNFE